MQTPLDVDIQFDEDDLIRTQQIGETRDGRILVIVATWRGDAIRVISAWDAPRAFKSFYLEQKASEAWKESE